MIGRLPPAPAGAVYTCPMHPEVRQDHPGACPKCGMALEPEMPSLDEGENPELVDFRRRFGGRLPATLAIAVLAMSRPSPGDDGHVDPELGRARALAAGGAVGGLAVLRPRGAVGRQSQPQHVHPDRPRHRRRLPLQRRRHRRAGPLPGVLRHDGPGVGLFRGRGGDHHAGAARPGARAEGARPDLGGDPRRSSAWPRTRRGGSPPTAAKRTCRWLTSTRATCCGSARARRCRSTASSSRAAVPSTSRC